MTREDASKIWPVLKAYAEGKSVEIHCAGGGNSEAHWMDADMVKVDEGCDFPYRVKGDANGKD